MEVKPASEASKGSQPLSLWERLAQLLKPLAIERFKIIDVADPKDTIEGIKRDVEFRGFNLWILVFSIFICSIGLNVNSTAVVIGAMLISPLMGPIMGLGLGIGVQDASIVRSSLSNLAIAAGISILASALYFFVSPIHEASNELFARTQPTFLDVMVALFGGLAGILAGSRKEKSNVVPGVAIATALMPPLCTAGYGLANGEWGFLLGGFYLFLINTMLIATATALVIRYLRFPVVHLVDTVTERKYKRWFTILLLALVIPSTYIFYSTVSTSIEDAKIQDFVEDRINYPGMELVSQNVDRDGEVSRLNLVLIGEFVPEPTVVQWREDFARLIPGVAFKVVQNSRDDAGLAELERMVDLYAQGREELSGKDRKIAQLRTEIMTLEAAAEAAAEMQLPESVVDEMLILFPELVRIQWGAIDDLSLDSLGARKVQQYALFELEWKEGLDSLQQGAEERRLQEFLDQRMAPIAVGFGLH